MGLYFKVFTFYVKRWFVYPLEILAEALKYIVSLFGVYLLWSLILIGGGQGEQINDLLGYFMIAGFIGTVTLSGNPYYGRELRHAIKDGEISNFFIKPVKVLPYFFSRALGKKAVVIFITMIGFILGIAISSEVSILAIVLFVPMLLVALLIGLAVNLVEGALTFYFTEITGFKNAVNHLVKVFSGALVPLQFFPDSLRQIIELTPFPAMIYGPSTIISSSEPFVVFNTYFWIGLIWGGILILIALLIWRKAAKSYEAIGI